MTKQENYSKDNAVAVLIKAVLAPISAPPHVLSSPTFLFSPLGTSRLISLSLSYFEIDVLLPAFYPPVHSLPSTHSRSFAPQLSLYTIFVRARK